MNESEAILVVERGPVPSTQIPLQEEQLTIGRSAGNDIVLADPEVSRRHLRVVRRVDGFAIEDIGSTNGTFVNGQRISHLTLLQDGDTIDLGDTVRLRFMTLGVEEGFTPVDMSERPTQMVTPEQYQGAIEGNIRPQALPQPPRPAIPEPAFVSTPAGSPAIPSPPAFEVETPRRRGRGLLVGCGLIAALLLVCAGTFLILDAYDQGRLLYCGPMGSFFELILGPFGFAPICP